MKNSQLKRVERKVCDLGLAWIILVSAGFTASINRVLFDVYVLLLNKGSVK